MLNAVKSTTFREDVIIIYDASFSAEWCFEARRLMESGNYNFNHLSLKATCGRDQIIECGHSRLFLNDGKSR